MVQAWALGSHTSSDKATIRGRAKVSIHASSRHASDSRYANGTGQVSDSRYANGTGQVSGSRYANNTRQASGSGVAAGIGWLLARLMFFMLAFVLLFGGLTLVRTFASEEHVQQPTGTETVIYADAGDTLWTLASSLKKESMDTRQAVYLLMERNDLRDSALQNGQMLIVPNEILP
ncbi:LysM peptidoglycan-binding domain-containing protein [Cohnella sp. CFH 77786]|uniref:LysM peptidoglycan-binding domain-containing protein n=1 Tax=Cohnella sp. CFH 77786 TaxID=2662265 RepID=UPI001C60A2E1|nr:LysM peptidoglycan-binding domain-containing protein [Cohnella sp. CFH 77786]MBW5448185.1 LysM peptidoglycan-binding domain-containing protein [Cohnella sp. CFH 77786]